MITYTSLDLQKRTGDIQNAVAREPVVITHHAKPRSIMLSVEEYLRLKGKAGEPVPAELKPRRAVVVRGDDDPLGYDVSDIDAAIRHMIDDFRSGRSEGAVQDELKRVRRRFAKSGEDGR